MEQLKAVILAAGKGTRMKSDLPKVVHTIEGKCLVDYAIEAAIGAGAEDMISVWLSDINMKSYGRRSCIRK